MRPITKSVKRQVRSTESSYIVKTTSHNAVAGLYKHKRTYKFILSESAYSFCRQKLFLLNFFMEV